MTDSRHDVSTWGHVLGQWWINDTMLVREVRYWVSDGLTTRCEVRYWVSAGQQARCVWAGGPRGPDDRGMAQSAAALCCLVLCDGRETDVQDQSRWKEQGYQHKPCSCSDLLKNLAIWGAVSFWSQRTEWKIEVCPCQCSCLSLMCMCSINRISPS